MEIRGKVAVVTGASSGIGWETALAFAREGADLAVAARRLERLEELARLVAKEGRRALPVACDVSERDQVERLRDRVAGELGRCDVLVNNAGVPGGGPFADLTWDQVEQIVRINVMGVLYGSKAFLDMLTSSRGHIVNVASLAGRFAVPGASVYTATKHAVVAFSEALHYELAPRGVRVTSVNPGLVETEGFPHRDAVTKGRRVMKPEQVARLIVRVVRTDKAPEISIPRALAAAQAVRVLAPPLYRFGLQRATRGSLRSTRVDERDRSGDGEPGSGE